VGRNGGGIELWNVRSLDAVKPIRLAGHSGTVLSLAFSQNGRWLASASGDDTTRIWDLRSPGGEHAYATLEGHEENVNDAVFSPCTKWVYTAGHDGTIRQWDLTRPREQIDFVELRGHQDWITDLVVSADGRLLVSGGNDGTTRLWHLDPVNGWDRQPPIVLTAHAEPRTATVVSEHWIATTALDGAAQLHPRKTTQLLDSVPLIVGRGFSDTELAEYFPDEFPDRSSSTTRQ
jgi:WD40 repeat protein